MNKYIFLKKILPICNLLFLLLSTYLIIRNNFIGYIIPILIFIVDFIIKKTRFYEEIKYTNKKTAFVFNIIGIILWILLLISVIYIYVYK